MKKLLISAAIAIVLVACGSTRITSSWKSDRAARSFEKILVLGLVNEPDRVLREEMEQNLVANLKEKGYDAICSCEEFSPKSFESLTEKQALSKLDKGGIDAVLTIVLLDKQKERYYVPDRVAYTPFSPYHRRFWGYYNTMYTRVYAPGYYVTNTRYFWESNFYDMKNGQELLYSVQSQSFDPSSAKTMGKEYGQLIAGDLVKKNVLSQEKDARPKPM